VQLPAPFTVKVNSKPALSPLLFNVADVAFQLAVKPLPVVDTCTVIAVLPLFVTVYVSTCGVPTATIPRSTLVFAPETLKLSFSIVQPIVCAQCVTARATPTTNAATTSIAATVVILLAKVSPPHLIV